MNNVDAADVPQFVEEPPQRLSRGVSVLVVIAAVAVLGAWMASTPSGLEGKVDAIGYAICHRIASHSFLINGLPMPLCARCTGIYLGVMTCFLIAVASGRTRVSRLPSRGVIAMLVLFVGIMGIDGINSYIHFLPNATGIYQPENWLRLTTGMFCGVAMFNLVFPVFNGMVWANPDPGRSVNNLRELAGICLVIIVVTLLVLTQRPVFLYVFGIISTLGVALMLTMIATVLFLSVLRRDRIATEWRHLAIPMLAGLTIAFIEIGGIDFVRYLLTGTWNGFGIGG